jgi:hypothetical protein
MNRFIYLLVLILFLLCKELMSQNIQNKKDVTGSGKTGTMSVRKNKKYKAFEIEAISKTKTRMSYKIANDKIYLYGTGEVYRVLQFSSFNNSNSPRIYLYLEGKYYELNPNQTKITKLEELKDASTLQKLKDHDKK